MWSYYTQITATDKLVLNGLSCRIVENYIYLPMSPIHKKTWSCAVSNIQYV